VRRPADDDDTPLTSGWRRKRARTASDADDGEEEAEWTFDEDVYPDVDTDGVACSDLLGTSAASSTSSTAKAAKRKKF
jgi:hypothetical protein